MQGSSPSSGEAEGSEGSGVVSSSTALTASTALPTTTLATDGTSTLATMISDGSVPTAAPSSSTRVEDTSSATPAPTQQGDDSLNTGAAAGIGVGATLGVVALIVIGIWMLRRRRRKGPKTPGGSDGPDGHATAVPTLFPKAEKDGLERFEAPDTGRPAEADGNVLSELEGDSLVPGINKKTGKLI